MSVSHKKEKWAGKHSVHNSILRQRNTIFPQSFLPHVLWNELFKTIYLRSWKSFPPKRSLINILFAPQEMQHSLWEKVLVSSVYGFWLNVLFTWLWNFWCHDFNCCFLYKKSRIGGGQMQRKIVQNYCFVCSVGMTGISFLRQNSPKHQWEFYIAIKHRYHPWLKRSWGTDRWSSAVPSSTVWRHCCTTYPLSPLVVIARSSLLV